MFKLVKNSCKSVLLAGLSFSAYAHPGHDHSANSAFYIHLLWLAPIALAAYVIMNHLKNKKAKK